MKELSIADCRLPIGRLRSGLEQNRHSAIGNRQSQSPIGNWQSTIGNDLRGVNNG